jgi:hypothetical protein
MLFIEWRECCWCGGVGQKELKRTSGAFMELFLALVALLAAFIFFRILRRLFKW